MTFTKLNFLLAKAEINSGKAQLIYKSHNLPFTSIFFYTAPLFSNFAFTQQFLLNILIVPPKQFGGRVP